MANLSKDTGAKLRAYGILCYGSRVIEKIVKETGRDVSYFWIHFFFYEGGENVTLPVV